MFTMTCERHRPPGAPHFASPCRSQGRGYFRSLQLCGLGRRRSEPAEQRDDSPQSLQKTHRAATLQRQLSGSRVQYFFSLQPLSHHLFTEHQSHCRGVHNTVSITGRVIPLRTTDELENILERWSEATPHQIPKMLRTGSDSAN